MIDLQQVWNMPGGHGNSDRTYDPYTDDWSRPATPVRGRDPIAVGDETVTGGDTIWDYQGQWAYPDQWGAGGYNMNWMEKADDIPANPMQQWYRDPSWGGHIGWQPEYGFQDWTDVGNQVYHTGGWEQDYSTFQQNMQAAGFTPQMGTWEQYFPDRVTAGTASGWQPGEDTGYLVGGMPGDPGGMGPGTGGYDMTGYQGAQDFQYPWQWGMAGDVLGSFAQGMPTGVPNIWNQGAGIASQMGQTGMPTDTSPAYQASKKVVEQDTIDAIKQAAEQAGLSGLRWSTPMGRTAQDIAGRNMAQLGASWTQQEMGAQEAARQRQLEGSNQMFQYGAGSAGLEESAKNRSMQAVSGLQGLGGQYLQAPQDWAQQMYGMGSGMQGQGQQALDKYYQDFMRLLPENSPWLQMAQQYANPGMGMGGAQQYQQGAGGGILDMVGGIGTGIAALCGGG